MWLLCAEQQERGPDGVGPIRLEAIRALFALYPPSDPVETFEKILFVHGIFLEMRREKVEGGRWKKTSV